MSSGLFGPGAVPPPRPTGGVRTRGTSGREASNIARWANAGTGMRCRGNTWFIPYETIQSRDRDRPHPATFPARLPEFCLRLHGCDRIGRVVDPFLGLGSTAVACATLGLPFDGIEMDQGYLGVAIARAREALAAASGLRQGRPTV